MATALRPRSRPLEYLPGIRANLRAMDDVGLVGAYTMGNEFAMNEIVERYQTRLLNFVYCAISDRERAEEIVQETFVRVWQHIKSFDRTKKFSTWIYVIASNLAKNELRNRARNPLIFLNQLQGPERDDDNPIEFEDPKTMPDDMLHKRHLELLVEKSIKKLPSNYRQVFVLRECEGKTYGEIASICDCRIGTVKSRLNRARTAFAAIIGPYID
jgi:RNA polymerase sigma-70 factor (ECF subfamily)